MKSATLALLCFLLPLPVSAQEWPAALTEAIESAKAECSSFDGGEMTIGDAAVQAVDLTGDGDTAFMFDTFELQCSSAASAYCGTGGCALSLFVGETVTERLSKGWAISDIGTYRIILLQVHGSLCDGTNVNPCFEALVWDADRDRFNSVQPPPLQ